MQVEREWAWGLVVLGDPDDKEVVPTSLDSQGIAWTSATVVGRIQLAVDGPATASVSWDAEPAGMLLVHTGTLRLHSGRLRLTDAAAEQVQDSTVPAGEYAVRVLVDEREH